MSASLPYLAETQTLEPAPIPVSPDVQLPEPGRALEALTGAPPRSAWIEVDLKQLKRNYQLINQDKPPALQVLAVVKDKGYGHGALPVARMALDCGATFLGLSTLNETVTLR